MIRTRPAVWQVLRRPDLVVKSWPDGVVVYDEATGDIQALHPVAGEVLSWMLGCGLGDPDAFLNDLTAGDVTPEDEARLQTLMCEFEALGYVERILE